MPMTSAFRPRRSFVTTLILTAILTFPIAQTSAMPAIGEGSTSTSVPTSSLTQGRSEGAALQDVSVSGSPSGSTSGLTRTQAQGTPAKVCLIDWREGRWHVRQLIKCAARHFDVSVQTALHIADRESNFLPRAYNSWSCAKGIFQHLCRYWPDRAQVFGFRGWSAFNARANIMVTMKMVRRYGWEPWGG